MGYMRYNTFIFSLSSQCQHFHYFLPLDELSLEKVVDALDILLLYFGTGAADPVPILVLIYFDLGLCICTV